jgi:glycerol-3-phosphate cytidylyltransferase
MMGANFSKNMLITGALNVDGGIPAVTKVYTGGTFDLLHYGHINILQKCKEIAGTKGKVIVALNTDEFIEKYKGSSPVCNYVEREKVLLACRYVDQVVPNSDGEDSKPTIELVCPDYIVIGSDWARKDYYKQMSFTQDWLDENNISLVYVPRTLGVSTTDIKDRLR